MGQHFVHISDPHLSSLEGVHPRELLNKRLLGYLSWRRKRRAEHRPEILQALQSDLSGMRLEQLLVTGDLTHVGLPQEFAQAADWLASLGEARDVAVIPGNHDACVAVPWALGLGQWADYLASDEGGAGEFPSLRVRGDCAFIGLSSACPTPPLMASGSLGGQQLEALADALRVTRERGLFRVVFVHHPPLPGLEKWRKRLTDAPALQQVLQDNGAELVLHGHGHRAHRNTLDTRDGELQVIAVPSASALGLHGADTAAYNCYAVSEQEGGWQLEIACRQYDRESGTFLEAGQSSLDIKRPGRRPSPATP